MHRALLPWGPGRSFGVSGTGLLLSGAGCVTYSAARETTGTAGADLLVYDGGTANGQVLLDYSLSSGQSTSEQWGPHWLPYEEGLYLVTTSGSAVGQLVVYMDHRCTDWLDAEHWAAEAAMAELALRAGG